MANSSTPDKGSNQAASSGAGDGSTANDAGRDTFSMSVVPKGTATAKQSSAKNPGAGTPAQGSEKTIFEGGQLEIDESAAEGENPSKSDQNKDSKSQRKGQEGWQQLAEGISKLTERLDKLETKPAADANEEVKDGKKAENKQENEALAKALETINATNARLERMEFESDNQDLKKGELAAEWKKVNSDPKFKDFSMQERADYVRGRAGKGQTNAMQDQLSRAEGSMPRGAGGSGKSSSGGNPNVTEEDVAVGRAFGISREELERELS